MHHPLANVMPMDAAPAGELVNAITRDGARIVRVERLDGRRFVGPDRDYDARDLFGWLRPSPEAEERQRITADHFEEYETDRMWGREDD